MVYKVSKTMKKVTVTRRGAGKKVKEPKDALAIEDTEPMEAICDKPEMLRHRHVPNPMRYIKEICHVRTIYHICYCIFFYGIGIRHIHYPHSPTIGAPQSPLKREKTSAITTLYLPWKTDSEALQVVTSFVSSAVLCLLLFSMIDLNTEWLGIE